MLEETQETLPASDTLELTFRPFEIKTIKISTKRAISFGKLGNPIF